MIALIVAMDKQGLIGKENALPWHYPEDLKYFKRQTLNHTVVMGRKTYESIIQVLNKPLPNRDNIVLTTQEKSFKGARVIHDLQAFLETIPADKTVFIIGGRSVYQAALPFVDRLYITHINQTFEGDMYFPSYDHAAFQVVKEDVVGDLTFSVYERKGDHR